MQIYLLFDFQLIEVDKGFKVDLKIGTEHFGKEQLTPKKIQQPLEKDIPPIPIGAEKTQKVEKFTIFLCYSTLDSDNFKMHEIAKNLEDFPEIEKVLYWEEDSKENIVDYMEKALKSSNAFVIFCSENSANSESVKEEWQAAFQLRKKGIIKIVPVYEEEKFIPYLLTPLLNVKFAKDDFDGFIKNLYDEILR